jgi:GTP-binding protein
MPADGSDPIHNAKAIIHELEQYSPKLASKPRWLVFNKIDLLLEDEAQALCQEIADALGVETFYQISAFQKMHVDELCRDIMTFIETLPNEVVETAEDPQDFQWETYEARVNAELDAEFEDDDDDWDEDDDHPNVIYTKE